MIQLLVPAPRSLFQCRENRGFEPEGGASMCANLCASHTFVVVFNAPTWSWPMKASSLQGVPRSLPDSTFHPDVTYDASRSRLRLMNACNAESRELGTHVHTLLNLVIHRSNNFWLVTTELVFGERKALGECRQSCELSRNFAREMVVVYGEV